MDYETACSTFSWADILDGLGWTTDGPVNIAATVDRHVVKSGVAMDWHGKDGANKQLNFAEMAEASSRFANVLAGLGVAKGDRVAVIMPRVPETIIVMLGIWKAGAIYLPIFSAFGGGAIRLRLKDSGARVAITHANFKDSLEPVRDAVDGLIVVGGAAPDDIDFSAAMNAASDRFDPVPVARRDGAALLYTSGSTGPPKGVIISANFVAATTPGGNYCGDLRDGDVYWPTGDPAWGYGLVCYALALSRGIPVVMWEAQPNGETMLEFMAARGVTNLATVPTLLRAIMALGEDHVRSLNIPMRRIWCCGEPLNAEVVRFFRNVWGVTPLDTYGSSEMGLPVGNSAYEDELVKPGSMGRAVPGQYVTIIDENGEELGDEEVGIIAMTPSREGFYAVSYWNNPELTREVFEERWIATNDIGRRDGDGFLWFEGRADDVINSAGYRIGPFEVESALIEHDAVAEAGVVGKPDQLRGHIVCAHVVLKPGIQPDEDLEKELIAVVRDHLGAHATPREFHFIEELPKTESGKIQRFKLRQEQLSR
ncbi:MAG: AMP-binding protein [Pseudomonadota bacterium]|nr:AMP-binding protein [Pseudomonadota bacterium]